MKRLAFCIVMLLAVLSAPLYAQNFWEATSGPGAGEITSFAKGSNGFILATSSKYVYHSTDYGAHWGKYDTQFEFVGSSVLAIDGSSNAYAAASDNIYKSTDKGVSWNPIVHQPDANGTSSYSGIAIDPSGNIFVVSSRGMYVSSNNGSTWTLYDKTQGIPENLQLGGTELINSVYAAPDGTVYILTASRGISKTTNVGLLWTTAGFDESGQGSTVTLYSIAATKSGKLFAVTGSGFFMSANKGTTWTKLNNTGGLNTTSGQAVATDDNKGVMLITGLDGTWLSLDDGVTWTQTRAAVAGDGEQNALMIGDAAHFFVGTTTSGVAYSNDKGSTWKPRNTGITNASISAVCTDFTGHVYAQADLDLFSTTNGGDAWASAGGQITGTQILALAATHGGGYLYAAVQDSGMFQWDANSKNWTNIVGKFGSSIYKTKLTTIMITSRGHLYAGAQNGAIYRAYGNTNNWGLKRSGTTTSTITALAADAGGGKLYAANADSIFLSIDSAENWNSLAGSPQNTTAMAVDSIGTIYAATTGGLYYSADGTTWNKVSAVSNAKSIAVNSQGTVYVVGNAGTFYSADHGATWTSVNDNSINSLSPSAVIVDNTGRLYVGTANNGVYRSKSTITDDVPMHHAIELGAHFIANYPNPFVDQTIVGFTVGSASDLHLELIDARGNTIASLFNEFAPIGNYSVRIDAEALHLSAGTYFCRLSGEGGSVTEKIIYLGK